MKIAFIVSKFPSLSETFILNQITGLLDLGHDVEIFAQYNPKDKKVHPEVYNYRLMNRVHYFSIPHNKIKRTLKGLFLIFKNFFKSPLIILQSLNIFKFREKALSLRLLYIVVPFLNKRFDIIHCHFGPNGNIGIWLKEVGIPGKYITSFHGYDINSYPSKMGKNVYSILFSKGDLFTANTNFTKQQLIKYGCDTNKILLLPVGLEIDKFKFSVREIKNKETINLITVGRLVEKKGHKYALEAISMLKKEDKNIIYAIIGDGPLKGELENLVIELNIFKIVKFYGALEQSEVVKLYNESDIFLLPSITSRDGDREGQALVIQEAQACGLPVISTLHNGIPEGMIDGDSGFLVPEKDSNAIAEKIKYLIEHPEIWPQMGRCGREFVEKKYNIKELNNQLVKIYQDLIAYSKD